MKMSDEEILSSVSEHTGYLRGARWLAHIRYNFEHYGFSRTLETSNLDVYNGRKAVVLGAGPGFKRFGLDDLRKVLATNPVVLACDGALPLLAELGKKPTIVTSVDAHPVVANFYRRSRDILKGVTVILSTTIHRDVVNEAMSAGANIVWFQGMYKSFKDNGHLYWRDGVTGLDGGGNVGTTSYMIASLILKAAPIGLMGLEFAWSDETPLMQTQYYAEIRRIVGEKHPERIEQMFKKVRNPRDGKIYVADPVYLSYRTRFREIWKSLPKDVKANTYLLTKEGILTAPGLRFVSVEDFIRL